MPANKATITIACKQCGQEFLTWQYRINRGQDCCSIRCSADFRKKPLVERFARYLAPINENGCINWTGATNKWGYGKVGGSSGTIAAHRFAWEQANGPITDGLWVLHKCDNRLCCNPDHLFLGTVQDNMDDCCEKQRQARGSKQGSHKLSEELVAAIRDSYARGETQTRLAGTYGVRQTTISRIVRGDSWKHV